MSAVLVQNFLTSTKVDVGNNTGLPDFICFLESFAAFLMNWQELEEDPELRARVQLYRSVGTPLPQSAKQMVSEDDDDDVPEVPLDELLSALVIGADHVHDGDYADEADDMDT